MYGFWGVTVMLRNVSALIGWGEGGLQGPRLNFQARFAAWSIQSPLQAENYWERMR